MSLEFLQLLSRLLPFSAGLKGLSSLAKSYLLLQIGLEAVFVFGVEGTFLHKEGITGSLETVVNFLVLLAACKTYGSPLLLDILDFL